MQGSNDIIWIGSWGLGIDLVQYQTGVAAEPINKDKSNGQFIYPIMDIAVINEPELKFVRYFFERTAENRYQKRYCKMTHSATGIPSQ